MRCAVVSPRVSMEDGLATISCGAALRARLRAFASGSRCTVVFPLARFALEGRERAEAAEAVAAAQSVLSGDEWASLDASAGCFRVRLPAGCLTAAEVGFGLGALAVRGGAFEEVLWLREGSEGGAEGSGAFAALQEALRPHRPLTERFADDGECAWLCSLRTHAEASEVWLRPESGSFDGASSACRRVRRWSFLATCAMSAVAFCPLERGEVLLLRRSAGDEKAGSALLPPWLRRHLAAGDAAGAARALERPLAMIFVPEGPGSAPPVALCVVCRCGVPESVNVRAVPVLLDGGGGGAAAVERLCAALTGAPAGAGPGAGATMAEEEVVHLTRAVTALRQGLKGGGRCKKRRSALREMLSAARGAADRVLREAPRARGGGAPALAALWPECEAEGRRREAERRREPNRAEELLLRAGDREKESWARKRQRAAQVSAEPRARGGKRQRAQRAQERGKKDASRGKRMLHLLQRKA